LIYRIQNDDLHNELEFNSCQVGPGSDLYIALPDCSALIHVAPAAVVAALPVVRGHHKTKKCIGNQYEGFGGNSYLLFSFF
jgi:hypothetical protein